MTGQQVGGLVLLAVDDEPPALDELAYLLRRDARVAEVLTAEDGVAALGVLESRAVDGVFLDIRMPGLDGLALARVLGRFAVPPGIVFVTAHDDAAVPAFALDAVDYLLKPVRAERLAEAVRRLAARSGAGGPTGPEGDATALQGGGGQTVAVDLAGVTRFLPLAEVRYAEASGDYVRLHTVSGTNHLLRVSMGALEERWARSGFVRVHRSFLVAAAHIAELRVEPGGTHLVRVGPALLPVSRRHARALKDRLVRRASRDSR